MLEIVRISVKSYKTFCDMNIVLDFRRFCCSTLYPRWPLLSPQRPVDPSLFCHALKHAWWDGLGCTRKLIMTHRHGRHRHSWQTWHNSFSNVLASCLPFCRPGWQGRRLFCSFVGWARNMEEMQLFGWRQSPRTKACFDEWVSSPGTQCAVTWQHCGKSHWCSRAIEVYCHWFLKLI